MESQQSRRRSKAGLMLTVQSGAVITPTKIKGAGGFGLDPDRVRIGSE